MYLKRYRYHLLTTAVIMCDTLGYTRILQVAGTNWMLQTVLSCGDDVVRHEGISVYFPSTQYNKREETFLSPKKSFYAKYYLQTDREKDVCLYLSSHSLVYH